MLYRLSRTERFAAIADRLYDASHATLDLMSAIMREAYDENANDPIHTPEEITKLISARAWTDAGLALIADKLPKWKLRRLVYDEGQWHCALSLQPDLPEWLDDAIETSHWDLSLAILSAFVEALRQLPEAPRATRIPTIPRVRAMQDETIFCENFV